VKAVELGRPGDRGRGTGDRIEEVGLAIGDWGNLGTGDWEGGLDGKLRKGGWGRAAAADLLCHHLSHRRVAVRHPHLPTQRDRRVLGSPPSLYNHARAHRLQYMVV
jgi:hypothetical protein